MTRLTAVGVDAHYKFEHIS